jgi:DNA gyrase/topoisomerase IV subunit A
MKVREIKDTHKRLIGRVSTLKRMLEKRKERIINNKMEMWEIQKELDVRQTQLKKVVKVWKFTPSFKRKRRGKYYYWIGFVQLLKRNPSEFHIGTDEVFNKNSKTYWINRIRESFLKKITEKDFEGYLRGEKSKFGTE